MKIALLVLALSATQGFAQANTCGGLTSVVDGANPVYPPIARAAHVSGMVILLTSFQPSGKVDSIKIVSGPPMLQQAASAYVKAWTANVYTGPRMCPVIVQFELSNGSCDQSAPLPATGEHIDTQHVTIHGQAMMLCDPSATIGKRRRRFWFF